MTNGQVPTSGAYGGVGGGGSSGGGGQEVIT